MCQQTSAEGCHSGGRSQARWDAGGGGHVHSTAKRLTSTVLEEMQWEDNAEVSEWLRAGARVTAAAAATTAGTWTLRC